MAITFHGGMRAIAYEWGGPNHEPPNDKSPDHQAQYEISKIMQILGGDMSDKARNTRNRWNQLPPQKNYHYPIETLNKIVYSVIGGMEDWAYAGMLIFIGYLKSHKNHKKIKCRKLGKKCKQWM